MEDHLKIVPRSYVTLWKTEHAHINKLYVEVKYMVKPYMVKSTGKYIYSFKNIGVNLILFVLYEV